MQTEIFQSQTDGKEKVQQSVILSEVYAYNSIHISDYSKYIEFCAIRCNIRSDLHINRRVKNAEQQRHLLSDLKKTSIYVKLEIKYKNA